MASLTICAGDSIRRISVDGDRLTVGRTAESDLQLADDRVSRHHGELVRSGSSFSWRDLGSHNGSTVNGVRVREKLLEPGDEIAIGSTLLIFSDDSDVLVTHRMPEEYCVELRGSGTMSLLRDASAAVQTGALASAVERFELLDRVGRAVLSASSLDHLLELALTLMLDSIKAERGSLFLREADSDEITYRLHRHRNSSDAPEIHVPRSIVREVVSRKVAVVTSDAKHDPRFQEGQSIMESDIRSALCVPLWEEDEILGVIYLDSRIQSYAFTRNDLVLASAIANLIAIRLKQEQLNAKLAEQRLVRANLERYHSPEVVDVILARPGGPNVGLEEREVSILFGDIQGFTALAEKMRPSEVAAFVNGYYDLATEVIFEHGGTVTEYIGDALMAIFGAPIGHQDHAHRAVAAGLELLRRVARRRESAPAGALRYNIRVAVNSGEVVVGSVGTSKRLAYTVIGDAVNVAARLERLCEPNTLAIGENTFAALKGGFACQDLGATTLRGRDRPIRVYRVESLRASS